jgi:hypothetical protein
MTFVPPGQFEGLFIHIFWLVIVPLIITIIAGVLIWKATRSGEGTLIGIVLVFILAFAVMVPVFNWGIWHPMYEVPSVQETTITVADYRPVPNPPTNDMGAITIKNPKHLMIYDTDGNGWYNDENFLFDKFDTSDVLFKLKKNGTYVIKYYGWRNPFNSGFPTILEVVEVKNETNAVETDFNSLFGMKLATG